MLLQLQSLKLVRVPASNTVCWFWNYPSNISLRLNKRMFSATPVRRIDEGSLILMQHATVTPIFNMALIFISFTLTIGGFLVRELQRPAMEAQHLEMFPEDLVGPFFAVPQYTMDVLFRFIFRVNQSLDFWCDVDNLILLTTDQANELYSLLPIVRDMMLRVRKYCEFITDLDDSYLNAHLEFLITYIERIDIILNKIADLQDLILLIFLST